MTKEQEEAIKYFEDEIKVHRKQIDKLKEEGQFEGNGTMIDIYKLKICMTTIILNMLKEKDAEIEKYKKLLADNLAKDLNNSIKAKHKANTDLEFLNLGWKTEIEKKDKMIDLMAEELQKHIYVLYDGDTITSKKGIIQHYERKVEDERNKI